MAIAALLYPSKILPRFGGWQIVGWQRPRNRTTVRPAWGALPPRYGKRRQDRASGRDAAANSGRQACTSLLPEKSIKECKSDGDDELGPQGRDHRRCRLGTGDVDPKCKCLLAWRLLGMWGLCRGRYRGRSGGAPILSPGLLCPACRRRPARRRGSGSCLRISGLPGPSSLSLLLPLSGRIPHALIGQDQSEWSIGATSAPRRIVL
jgi:hypothetical protein